MSNLPARPTVVSATDSVAREPAGAMHGCMVSQAGHAASPVCSIAVHRGWPPSERGPALSQAVCVPSPACSLAGLDPVAPGDQQVELKDAGAHPRVQQIAQLCTSIFEVPLVVAAVASGPTNFIFIQQVSQGWCHGQRRQVQTPCSSDPSASQKQHSGQPSRPCRHSVSCDSSYTICCLQRAGSLMVFLGPGD